jgi:hypothetical protein
VPRDEASAGDRRVGLSTGAKVAAGAFVAALYAGGMIWRGYVVPGIVGGVLAGVVLFLLLTRLEERQRQRQRRR